MKAILLLLAMVPAAIQAQLKWSVHAGMVNTGISQFENLTGGPAHNRGNGFTAGGTAGFTLYKSLYTESSLSFAQKRINYISAPLPDYYSRYQFTVNYFTLGQDLLVKIPAAKNLSFSAGAGLFFAAAASGTYRREVSTFLSYMKEEGNVKIGNTEFDDFKPFDAGTSLLLRSQYRKVQLTLRWSPSFISFVPGNRGSEKLSSLFYTLGWQF